MLRMFLSISPYFIDSVAAVFEYNIKQQFMDNNQQWILVTKKSKCVTKNNNSNKKKPKQIHQVSNTVLNKQKQKQYSEMLLNSNIFQQIMAILEEKIQSHQKQNEESNNGAEPLAIWINILGIGNFIDFKKPYLQYLLVKFMINQIKSKFNLRAKINAFDPVFTVDCLNKLSSTFENITFKPPNKTKQQTGAENVIKLYYMIHCQKELYTEILNFQTKMSNSTIIIVGNSLRQYNERLMILGKQVIKEFKIWNMKEVKLDDFEQAFNDTYFMST